MYWYKRTRAAAVLIGCGVLACTACAPDNKDSGGAPKYFDIKGYFTADIARLNKQNRLVKKTVDHNGVAETKNVKIDNWGQELDSFLGADINRPAWKNSYNIATGDSLLLYTAKDPALKVREIIIKKMDGKLKWIVIFTKTENILYTNIEKLSYYPDSLYLIQKSQHVRLMGNNHYRIQGIMQR